jgi:hypothetical protein
VLAAVQADDQQHAIDPEAFRDGLSHSQAEGSFRLVTVLDSAPDELMQVIGYLQSVTDKINIDLVTAAAYDVTGSRVPITQRIEPARRAREMSDAQLNACQRRDDDEYESALLGAAIEWVLLRVHAGPGHKRWERARLDRDG